MCLAVNTTEDALAARLIQSTVGALELYGIHLGKELGLYELLAAHGPMSPAELAQAAGIAPRYAREWLEQQAVAGLLFTDDTSAAADARRFSLPSDHVNVLVTADHPSHLAPLAQMVAGIGGALERVARAYRTGSGVPYPAFGAAFRSGQAGVNRPAFVRDLATQWLPAVGDLYEALRSRRLRVADVGCGAGWSTQAVAQAFPLADVTGFDSDVASVDDARRYAADLGVPVRFEVRDAAALADAGAFDLVLLLEALHDMARPTEALRAIRHALVPGGSVLIAEENVGERFHAPAGEIERLMYGWSIVHCLPVALAEQPSAGIGTVMRPAVVGRIASDAGFSRIDVLPVDAGFFRLYRLRVG